MRCSRSARWTLSHIAAHMNRYQSLAAPAEYLRAHRLPMQHDKKECERDRHNEKRNEKRRVNSWPICAEDTCGLVKRVPPIHRKFDDRNVHYADQAQNGGSAASAARFFDCATERDQAKIKKK